MAWPTWISYSATPFRADSSSRDRCDVTATRPRIPYLIMLTCFFLLGFLDAQLVNFIAAFLIAYLLSDPGSDSKTAAYDDDSRSHRCSMSSEKVHHTCSIADKEPRLSDENRAKNQSYSSKINDGTVVDAKVVAEELYRLAHQDIFQPIKDEAKKGISEFERVIQQVKDKCDAMPTTIHPPRSVSRPQKLKTTFTWNTIPKSARENEHDSTYNPPSRFCSVDASVQTDFESSSDSAVRSSILCPSSSDASVQTDLESLSEPAIHKSALQIQSQNTVSRKSDRPTEVKDLERSKPSPIAEPINPKTSQKKPESTNVPSNAQKINSISRTSQETITVAPAKVQEEIPIKLPTAIPNLDSPTQLNPSTLPDDESDISDTIPPELEFDDGYEINMRSPEEHGNSSQPIIGRHVPLKIKERATKKDRCPQFGVTQKACFRIQKSSKPRKSSTKKARPNFFERAAVDAYHSLSSPSNGLMSHNILSDGNKSVFLSDPLPLVYPSFGKPKAIDVPQKPTAVHAQATPAPLLPTTSNDFGTGVVGNEKIREGIAASSNQSGPRNAVRQLPLPEFVPLTNRQDPVGNVSAPAFAQTGGPANNTSAHISSNIEQRKPSNQPIRRVNQPMILNIERPNVDRASQNVQIGTIQNSSRMSTEIGNQQPATRPVQRVKQSYFLNTRRPNEHKALFPTNAGSMQNASAQNFLKAQPQTPANRPVWRVNQPMSLTIERPGSHRASETTQAVHIGGTPMNMLNPNAASANGTSLIVRPSQLYNNPPDTKQAGQNNLLQSYPNQQLAQRSVEPMDFEVAPNDQHWLPGLGQLSPNDMGARDMSDPMQEDHPPDGIFLPSMPMSVVDNFLPHPGSQYEHFNAMQVPTSLEDTFEADTVQDTIRDVQSTDTQPMAFPDLSIYSSVFDDSAESNASVVLEGHNDASKTAVLSNTERGKDASIQESSMSQQAMNESLETGDDLEDQLTSVQCHGRDANAGGTGLKKVEFVENGSAGESIGSIGLKQSHFQPEIETSHRKSEIEDLQTVPASSGTTGVPDSQLTSTGHDERELGILHVQPDAVPDVPLTTTLSSFSASSTEVAGLQSTEPVQNEPTQHIASDDRHFSALDDGFYATASDVQLETREDKELVISLWTAIHNQLNTCIAEWPEHYRDNQDVVDLRDRVLSIKSLTDMEEQAKSTYAMFTVHPWILSTFKGIISENSEEAQSLIVAVLKGMQVDHLDQWSNDPKDDDNESELSSVLSDPADSVGSLIFRRDSLESVSTQQSTETETEYGLADCEELSEEIVTANVPLALQHHSEDWYQTLIKSYDGLMKKARSGEHSYRSIVVQLRKILDVFEDPQGDTARVALMSRIDFFRRGIVEAHNKAIQGETASFSCHSIDHKEALRYRRREVEEARDIYENESKRLKNALSMRSLRSCLEALEEVYRKLSSDPALQPEAEQHTYPDCFQDTHDDLLVGFPEDVAKLREDLSDVDLAVMKRQQKVLDFDYSLCRNLDHHDIMEDLGRKLKVVETRINRSKLRLQTQKANLAYERREVNYIVQYISDLNASEKLEHTNPMCGIDSDDCGSLNSDDLFRTFDNEDEVTSEVMSDDEDKSDDFLLDHHAFEGTSSRNQDIGYGILPKHHRTTSTISSDSGKASPQTTGATNSTLNNENVDASSSLPALVNTQASSRLDGNPSLSSVPGTAFPPVDFKFSYGDQMDLHRATGALTAYEYEHTVREDRIINRADTELVGKLWTEIWTSIQLLTQLTDRDPRVQNLRSRFVELENLDQQWTHESRQRVYQNVLGMVEKFMTEASTATQERVQLSQTPFVFGSTSMPPQSFAIGTKRQFSAEEKQKLIGAIKLGLGFDPHAEQIIGSDDVSHQAVTDLRVTPLQKPGAPTSYQDRSASNDNVLPPSKDRKPVPEDERKPGIDYDSDGCEISEAE